MNVNSVCILRMRFLLLLDQEINSLYPECSATTQESDTVNRSSSLHSSSSRVLQHRLTGLPSIRNSLSTYCVPDMMLCARDITIGKGGLCAPGVYCLVREVEQEIGLCTD